MSFTSYIIFVNKKILTEDNVKERKDNPTESSIFMWVFFFILLLKSLHYIFETFMHVFKLKGLLLHFAVEELTLHLFVACGTEHSGTFCRMLSILNAYF